MRIVIALLISICACNSVDHEHVQLSSSNKNVEYQNQDTNNFKHYQELWEIISTWYNLDKKYVENNFLLYDSLYLRDIKSIFYKYSNNPCYDSALYQGIIIIDSTTHNKFNISFPGRWEVGIKSIDSCIGNQGIKTPSIKYSVRKYVSSANIDKLRLESRLGQESTDFDSRILFLESFLNSLTNKSKTLVTTSILDTMIRFVCLSPYSTVPYYNRIISTMELDKIVDKISSRTDLSDNDKLYFKNEIGYIKSHLNDENVFCYRTIGGAGLEFFEVNNLFMNYELSQEYHSTVTNNYMLYSVYRKSYIIW